MPTGSECQQQQQQQLRVAIVGCGITGISCGLRILQSLPQAAVTIFSESVSPNTTGDVAAGFWTPVYLSNTPHQLTDRWSEDTYKYLQSLLREEPNADRTGVFYCPGYQLSKDDQPPEITWREVPIGFRQLTSRELRMFPAEYRSGYFYVSLMAEGKKLIPALMRRFFALGGQLVPNKRVKCFNELFDLGYDRVVNCSGIGARQLCNDESVFPIRGQVVRAVAPWLNFWITDDSGAYCLPNTETVVLGGVSQSNNWSLEVSQSDRASILQRVHKLWPQLSAAKIVEDSVGLRPGRDSVRLERERTACDRVIYHNYGHGGSGLTLFWGCAGDVLQMLLEDMNAGTKAKL